MKNGFSFFPGRRIYARCWRKKLPVPVTVGAIAAGLLITFYGGAALGRCMDPLWAMVIASFASTAVILLGFALTPPLGSTGEKSGFRKMTPEDWKCVFIALPLITCGSLLITHLWQYLLEVCRIPYAPEQGLIQLVRGAGGGTFMKMLLLTAVAVPLAEELMFRRSLYALLSRAGGPAGFVGSAAVFAAAHGFLLGIPGLFFMGLVFQTLANIRRNLWCSVLCHGLHNSIVVTVAFFFTEK